MNVLFSSDNNYAQHLGAAIYSLLSHNKWCRLLSVYVIDNKIESYNKIMLKHIVDDFHFARLIFVDFSQVISQLHLSLEWNISLSSYARLFVASLLPVNIDKVLYLDCDVIINDSLEPLWMTDLENRCIAAIQDSVGREAKTAIGLSDCSPYFNAGVLLMNLKYWRDNLMEQKCISFILKNNGTVRHHDQGVLNAVAKDLWVKIPIRFNIMTLHYFWPIHKILTFYHEYSSFYSEEEIKKALSNPAVVHFTPSFTSRPWVRNCKHPMRSLYWEALSNTPWAGIAPSKDNTKWYVRLINWRYRLLKI